MTSAAGEPDGSAPGLSQMPRLNESEWLVEPFYEINARGLNWSLRDGAVPKAKMSVTWCSLDLIWESSAPGQTVARMDRQFNLDLLDADRLVLRAAVPEDCRLTLRSDCGGGDLTVVDRAPGRNRFSEYEGPVPGGRLEGLSIEIQTEAGGSGEIQFLWLIAVNDAARQRRRRNTREYDPAWPVLMRAEDAALEPQLGLLLPGSGVEGLRRRAASAAYRPAWEFLRARAGGFLDSRPERSVCEHLTRYSGASGGRYEHDLGPRTEERDTISRDAMRFCALVGLVEGDPAMARCALRHALAAAHCTHWEDSFMVTRPGSLWDHRAFTPMGWMNGFAAALDWAGALLTPAGRDLAARAISLKVLPMVEFSLRKYGYMRRNNQAIFFAHTGILAICTLGRLLEHGGEGLDRYVDLLRDCVETYVLDDGGTHEGGAYHDEACGSALHALIVAARFMGVPEKSLMPDRLLNSARYYRAMGSTASPGGFINTSDGGRPGLRFEGGGVPILARLAGREAMGALAATLVRPDADGNLRGAVALLAEGPDEPPGSPLEPPVFDVLADTGMLCSCRPTPGGPVRLQLVGAMACAGHGHEDKGSLVLEACGEEMLIDRGICFYGDARANIMKYSWLHNMLTPDDADGRPLHQTNPIPEAVIPVGRGDERSLQATIDSTPGWKRLEQPRKQQPPLRGCTQTAYDAKNRAIVLFGGHAQSKHLNDTWVYDVKTRTWSEKKPALSPRAGRSCGLTYAAKAGLIVMAKGVDDTWTYDVAANKWTRIKGHLGLGRKDSPGRSTAFMSCAYTPKDDLVLLLGLGGKERHNTRRTWVYRLDPATAAHAKQEGAQPGAFRYSIGEWSRLQKNPPPDRKATLEKLRNLPVNTMVNANPPQTVSGKTWSTATIDTDRGEVIYTGGGHSGYSGDDWAHYSVADNRWSMGWPPHRAPYMWACSVQPYGWAYGGPPWSTHTRHTYKYDPRSKMCVYLAGDQRPMNGQEMLLTEDYKDAFRYSNKKHGHIQYVYDPVKKKMGPPQGGCPVGHFDRQYGFVGTPHGLYLCGKINRRNRLFHGVVKDGKCTWKLINEKVPGVGGGEIVSMVYDSKRDRLLQAGSGGPSGVKILAYDPKAGKWETLKTTGRARLARDTIYNSKQDCVMMLEPKGRVWQVLDLATKEWKSLQCKMPNGKYGWDSALVYDPLHDVAVALLPTRFSGPTQVFLFRYDPSKATFRK